MTVLHNEGYALERVLTSPAGRQTGTRTHPPQTPPFDLDRGAGGNRGTILFYNTPHEALMTRQAEIDALRARVRELEAALAACNPVVQPRAKSPKTRA